MMLLLSCGRSEKTIEDNSNIGKNVIDFEVAEYNGDDNIINISDIKDYADTIEFRVAEGAYMGISNSMEKVRIKIPSEAELIGAEAKVTYYPTLWNDDFDKKLIQLIYLYDFPIVIRKNLPIKDGYFEYKYINTNEENDIKKLTNSLNSDILINSISNIPSEYSKKGCSTPGMEDWKTEEKEWIRMAKGFDNNKNIVEMTPAEEDIILTYRDKDGTEFKKVLTHTPLVGN